MSLRLFDCVKWFAFKIEHWAMLAIFLVIIGSWWWLFKMADAMKARPVENIKVEYVINAQDNQNPWYRQARVVFARSSDDEARCLQAYRDAEEHLREQMNSWLTILGLFGVLFGLLVPLASYLLQRHSLAEERARVTDECEKTLKSYVELFKDTIAKSGSEINGASVARGVSASSPQKATETPGAEANTSDGSQTAEQTTGAAK